MNRIAVAGLAAALSLLAPLTHAGAADMPLKAPAPPMASWTGCYIGGNTGKAWSSDNNIVLTQFGAVAVGNGQGSASGSGWNYGGQVGCDYQLNSTWVIGARGMWDGTRISGNANGVGPAGAGAPAYTDNFKTTSFATADVRIGYLLTPRFMAYGVAGVASVEQSASITASGGPCVPAACTAGTISDSRTGWNAGAGITWMLDPRWDFFVEYNYMGFGNKTLSYTPTGPIPFLTNANVMTMSQSLQTIMAGLDFRFTNYWH